MNKIKIIIDNEIVEKYLNYYFDLYPKRKVDPVKLFPPSMNTFMTYKRPQANSVKQKYKEYAEWLASYFGIANIMLENANIKYKFFYGDKRRRDIDNLMICPKFFNDGFVNAGIFIDDDGKHLGLQIDRIEYDKDHPRIEIEITEIENGKKN